MKKKTKYDELYETPTFFTKIIIYVKYHIRMLLWGYWSQYTAH